MPHIQKMLRSMANNVAANLVASGLAGIGLSVWGKMSHDWNWPAAIIMALAAAGGLMAFSAGLHYFSRAGATPATALAPQSGAQNDYPRLVDQTKEYYEGMLKTERVEIACVTEQKKALHKSNNDLHDILRQSTSEANRLKGELADAQPASDAMRQREAAVSE
jgi:hypothetical protein